MITIHPIGGLGNRLRVIHSVLSLQSNNHKPFILKWPKDRHMACSYFDLFDNHNGFHIKEYSENRVRRYLDKISRFSGIKMMNINAYKETYDNKKIRELQKNGYDFNRLFDEESIEIKTDCWFYTAEHGRFLMPEPSMEIRQKVDHITAYYPQSIIGVHIREGDNEIAKSVSTIDGFLSKIESEIKHNDSVHFYLSTDSPYTEEMLVNRFPGYFTVQKNKILDRDSAISAKDAFVDMLCLSKTNKIIGSYFSSFSSVAASISGIEKEVVR